MIKVIFSLLFMPLILCTNTNDNVSQGKNFRLCIGTDKEFNMCLEYEKRNNAVFSCIKAANQTDCIQMVSNNKADVTRITNDYGYEARSKFLKPIGFLNGSVTKQMIVVKSDKKLADLKGTFGCFSKSRDVAYISFVEHLRNLKQTENDLELDIAASYFLGDSCIPGILSIDLDDYRHQLAKLCSCNSRNAKTARNCHPTSDNEYFGNSGALTCLNQLGAFAVLSTDGLTNDKSFKVLCKNDTMANYLGFEVDNDCYISVTVKEEFVVRNNDTRWKAFLPLLDEIESYFGYQIVKPLSTYFNKYNGTTDIEFNKLNSTLTEEETYKNIATYLHIMNEYVNTFNPVSSSTALSSTCMSVILSIILYSYIF